MTPEMEIGTDRKALQINLDPAKYGTFAEIGAGQVAHVIKKREFFGYRRSIAA